MKLFKQGRYSGFLRPIFYTIDLLLINSLAFFVCFDALFSLTFAVVISLSWIIISFVSRFYEVYRYTRVTRILNLIFRQLLLFSLLIYAYLGINHSINASPVLIAKYIAVTFFILTIVKFLLFYLIKEYRLVFRGNLRKTIIIGASKQAKELELFLTYTPHLGLTNLKRMEPDNQNQFHLGDIYEYILKYNVDEIYCSVDEIKHQDLNEIVTFADNNLKTVKFVPEINSVFSRKLKHNFYGTIPILELRAIPLQDHFNSIIKRLFDIVFSSLVILFILSWLTPLIAIIVKLESKGTVFFSQLRNGYNYKSFKCLKFRSMHVNKAADLRQATRGDKRVTKVGRFLRKSSMDELPQFFNVLIGDMSVVGPRPHMLSHTEMYAKSVDKFMVRHFVKPGITGMAQVSGFRGEVETREDILGRVKFDIYYVENWSFLLDLKIIFQTFFNVLGGEEKAY